MDALLDTTVVIHLIRRYQPALAWFRTTNTYGWKTCRATLSLETVTLPPLFPSLYMSRQNLPSPLIPT